MATRKRPLTQAQKAARPRLKQLKKLGLFKGNVLKPSRYGIVQTRKFWDVLKGRAAVVKVPRNIAKEYKEQYRVKNGRVVVPKAEGETVRFSKKGGEIQSTREYQGTRISARKPRNIRRPEDLPRGKGIRYVVPFSGGTVRIRYDSWEQLVKDMTEYEEGRRGKSAYRNWWRYVEIEKITGREDEDEGGADF